MSSAQLKAQGSGFRAQGKCPPGPPLARAGAGQPPAPSQTLSVLVQVLETSLRLLHPIMPFVTEELWQHLKMPKDGGLRPPASIMEAEWPKASKHLIDEEAEGLFDRFQAVVGAIRNTRAELNVPLDRRPTVRLSSAKPALRQFFESHRPLLQALASTGEVTVDATRQRIPLTRQHAARMVVDGVEVVMPLEGLIDAGKERARLQQRVDELTKQLAGIDARLKDARFTSKAPNEIVEQTRARRAQAQDTLKKLSDHLELLQTM